MAIEVIVLVFEFINLNTPRILVQYCFIDVAEILQNG